jgi:hypothetical protein
MVARSLGIRSLTAETDVSNYNSIEIVLLRY